MKYLHQFELFESNWSIWTKRIYLHQIEVSIQIEVFESNWNIWIKQIYLHQFELFESNQAFESIEVIESKFKLNNLKQTDIFDSIWSIWIKFQYLSQIKAFESIEYICINLKDLNQIEVLKSNWSTVEPRFSVILGHRT